MKLALVTEDVPVSSAKAIAADAVAVKAPMEKPWGQIMGYVRSAEGSLIELRPAERG